MSRHEPKQENIRKLAKRLEQAQSKIRLDDVFLSSERKRLSLSYPYELHCPDPYYKWYETDKEPLSGMYWGARRKFFLNQSK